MTRFFDMLFSTIAIIIFFPFLLPIMIFLKLTGENDVFYQQIRVGRYGKDFGIFKFATMLRDSPNLAGGLYTQKNDPRILPIGHFLRKTKINELPQLINVFLGSMSMVGYRPTVRKHFSAYPETAQKMLFNSRPGLTGLGSIVFRHEEELLLQFEDKEHFHQYSITPYKAALECWYIEHRNIYTYFKLIFLTLFIIFWQDNNIWKKAFKDLPPIPSDLTPYI